MLFEVELLRFGLVILKGIGQFDWYRRWFGR